MTKRVETARRPALPGLAAHFLTFLFLTFLAAVSHAQAPEPPTAPAGRIARIAVAGNTHVPTPEILTHITEKVGDAYDPAAAQKDRAAVKAMGLFNGDVRLIASPNPAGGVDVTLTVAENPVVRDIRFTANTSDGRPTVPAEALRERLGVPVGQVLDTTTLLKGLDILVNHQTGYVSSLGYVFDISPEINIEPTTGVLTIPLIESHVEAIRVQGNRRVPTADILKAIRVKPGDVLDLKAVQQDMVRVYALGQFIEVGGVQMTPGKPGLVTLTIPVQEADPSALMAGMAGRVVPFDYDPPGVSLPVVQVSVNGMPPLPFIVDTGTSAGLVLDSTAAAKMGLTGKAPPNAGGGVPYTVAPIKGVVLKGKDPANDVAFDLTWAQIVDLDFMKQVVLDRHVAGIVGLGLLAPVTSRFDFQAHTLTVFAQTHPSLRLSAATVLPLTPTSQGLVTTRVTFSPGHDADMIVDTGSNGTQAPLASLHWFHIRKTLRGGFLQRIDGLSISPDLRLSDLTLGSLRLPDVVVSAVETASRPAATMSELRSPIQPSLGLNVLSRLRLILDPRNREILVEPAPSAAPERLGWTGLNIGPKGFQWTITRIERGSPAPKAGVKIGDEVVAIDGHTLAGLSQEGVYLLGHRQAAATRVRLTLRRAAGPPFDVSFTLPDVSQAPPLPINGLFLSKPQSKPWRVIGVIPGSPAARAGLKVNDWITAFGGERADTAPLDRLLLLFSAPVLPLTVERAGAAPRHITLKASAVPTRKEHGGAR